MSGAVAVQALAHRYGEVEAVADVSLSAAPGRVVALIGPTGCGKSTVLRVLAGLIVPVSGAATIDGASVIGRPGCAGYMPQADTLLPWHSALANATLGATIRGADRVTTTSRARDLFVRFGLAGFEDVWPSQLSGGMRQRVALLRTVLTDLPVMLLDEPFGALDAITRHDLQGWLAELLRDQPRTVLMVTHDIDEALRLADTVVVMSPRPGRVVRTITIGLPRPRSVAQLTQDEFGVRKREILGLLEPE